MNSLLLASLNGRVLVLLVALTAFTLYPRAARAFSGSGAGTKEAPYQVATIEQLQEVGQSLSANYVVVSDIDARPTRSWNGGAGFIPIGTHEVPFKGSLDAQGHRIVGLYINAPTNEYVGLFGFVNHGIVSGVQLTEAEVTGGSYVGTLAGTVSDQFQYRVILQFCSASGTCHGSNVVGGLLGSLYDCNVADSYSAVRVEGVSTVGGFAGAMCFSSIARAYSSGNVSGQEGVSGFVSYFNATAYKNTYVQNCFAAGTVTCSGEHGGGLAAKLATPPEFSQWNGSYYVDNRHTAPYGTLEPNGSNTFKGNTTHAVFLGWDFSTTWHVSAQSTEFPVLSFPEAPVAGEPSRRDGDGNHDSTHVHRTAQNRHRAGQRQIEAPVVVVPAAPTPVVATPTITAPSATQRLAVEGAGTTSPSETGTVAPQFAVGPVAIWPAIEIGWESVTGVTYQVQCTTDLISGVWSNIGPAVAGTGTPHSIFDTTRKSGQKYYRVVAY